MRLLPDIALQPDGVRSVNDSFRDEIEAILNRIVPEYIAADDLITIRASEVTEEFDWDALVERLVGPSISPGPVSSRYVRLKTSP